MVRLNKPASRLLLAVGLYFATGCEEPPPRVRTALAVEPLQPELTRELLAMGASDLELGPDGEIVGVNLFAADVGDAELTILGRLTALEHLVLSQTRAGDDCLAIVGRRKLLKRIMLGGTRVTDRGVAELTELEQLENLNLSSTQITDNVGASLRCLPGLRVLWLSDTEIGPATCQAISQSCLELRELRLGGAAVDDAAVAPLSEMTSLRLLDVTDTLVTEKGAAQLRAALPQAEVIYQPPPPLAPTVLAPASVGD